MTRLPALLTALALGALSARADAWPLAGECDNQPTAIELRAALIDYTLAGAPTSAVSIIRACRTKIDPSLQSAYDQCFARVDAYARLLALPGAGLPNMDNDTYASTYGANVLAMPPKLADPDLFAKLRGANLSDLPSEATYADIEALPEHLVGEILEGELVVSPRPGSPHAFTAGSIFGDTRDPFQRGRGGPGGWWILLEPELHLHDDVVVPDLAAWRTARMPAIPNVRFFDLAPDWVCENASPSTARHDRTSKMRIYARAEVRHLWIIDPLARTLEVFRLEHERWSQITAHAADEKVRAEPFDAVELALADWWLPEAPR